MKKILSFIIVVGLFAFDFAYASWWGEELLKSLLDSLHILWILPAIIAGKLMTNDFLYGAFMWFDNVLWNLWNLSRSFANYALWFIFLAAIFKFFYNPKEKDFSVVKTILPKIVIWSLLVNASWFLLWVLLDLSTILVAAFGSLPSVFVWQNPQMVDQVKIPSEIKIKLWNQSPDKWVFVEQVGERDVNTDKLLDITTTASWPLLYLWFSVLQLHSKQWNAWWWANSKSAGAVAAVSVTIALLFLLPIVLLAIVNAVRLFWIWIYISFAPLIILWIIFGKSKKEQFKLSNIIWLIFQPVLVVFALAIATVFVLVLHTWLINDDKSIMSMLNMDESTANQATITNPINEKKMLLTMTRDVQQSAGWFIVHTLVSLISIFFLFIMIKFSFQSTSITKWIVDGTFKFAKDMMKAFKIPWIWQSVWSLRKVIPELANIPSEISGKQSEKLRKVIDRYAPGAVPEDITENEMKKLETNIDYSNSEFYEQLKENLKGKESLKTSISTWDALENTQYLAEILYSKAKKLGFVKEDWKLPYGGIAKNPEQFKKTEFWNDMFEYIMKYKWELTDDIIKRDKWSFREINKDNENNEDNE